MEEVAQSEEMTVTANNITLVYDTFGNSSNPALLLISGLGIQMILWDEIFCKAIAARGFWVIRFDNRDIGLSTKFDEAGVPDLMELIQRVMMGEQPEVPYSLLDMAKDAIGLLDALNIESAHLVGASMGGMIAQMIAIHFPNRVRTLTSIMSTTGNPELPQPEPEVFGILVNKPPDNRDGYIEYSVEIWNLLNGPFYPLDEELVRMRAAKIFDRSYYPWGTGRQLAAVITSGNRNELLKKVDIPTLIIHGEIDPLVPVEGGKETAAMIPNSKLLIIEGMGHNIPLQVAPQIIEAISDHAEH
ncbi:MAG: alpha/beta fold hydrolase [Candidatus Heimdallarchaeota archaeon]